MCTATKWAARVQHFSAFIIISEPHFYTPLKYVQCIVAELNANQGLAVPVPHFNDFAVSSLFCIKYQKESSMSMFKNDRLLISIWN